MADLRAQLAARVRGMLSEALGVTRTRLGAAEAELTAARERLARVRRAAATVPARVGARTRPAAGRDRRAARRADSPSWPSAATEARRTGRPRARPARRGPGWQATPAGRGESPGPLRDRHGCGCPDAEPVPALVPLLDAGHVQLTGDDREGADAVVSALLLRALSARADPGAVRLNGYDPEHLGGGLAGFAPLGTAGLLTFVGPGRAGPAARRPGGADPPDQRDGAGRRVRARCASWPRRPADGPEPWRVAVLLGAGRAEPARTRPARPGAPHRRGLRACTWWSGASPAGRPEPSARVVHAGPGRGPHRRPGRPARYAWTRAHRPALVTATCREVAARVNAGPAPAPFTDLLPPPEQMWQEDSAHRADRADRRGAARPAGAADPGRLSAARADRRAVRHRQDQPDLRLDRRAGRPLLPRRAGVLSARLQGGGVLRPVRARAGATRAGCRTCGWSGSTSTPTGSSGWRCCASSPRSCAGGPTRPRSTRSPSWPSCGPVDPDRALAADRRGGRRVPGAARRPGRGRPGGRRPAGGPGPAGPLAGHPPGARLAGRVAASRRCGDGPRWSPSSPCGSRCPRRCGSSPRRNDAARGAAPATTRWSTPSRGRPRATRWPGSRRPATGTRWSELQHRLWRMRPADAARRGSSTATPFPGSPTAPDFRAARPAA